MELPYFIGRGLFNHVVSYAKFM